MIDTNKNISVAERSRSYDAYKDSGVEWLGEIPEHWEVKRLKFIFEEIQTGSTPSTSNQKFYGGNIDWYTPKDLDNDELIFAEKKLNQLAIKEREVKFFPEDSILIVGIGATAGKTSYLINKGTFNQQITGFHSHKVNNKYFFYLFFSLSDVMLNTANYTTLAILNNEFFKVFSLVKPPLSEQTAIAKFLDDKTEKIDQAISIKEQQIALLKEHKQILIHKAVTRGLDDSVPLKDSGVEWIGEIPEHWEVKSLRYAFEFLNYKRIPLSATEREKMQGKYPYYGASGIIDYVDNYIFDEKLILIGEDGANLLSKSTPLAFVAEGKYWVNNHAHILRPKYDGFPYWAEQLSLIDYTIFISGAAQPKLSRGNLSAVKVIVPILKDLKEISSHIESTSQKIDTAISLKTQEIEKLKEYKSSLINSVVTGKVKVS